MSTQASGGADRGTRNPAVVLLLLYLLNTLLVLDKIIFTVLLEPIKAEFKLTDLQLGLLAGTVYAICMGLASLPLGLAADRMSRRSLAAGCLAIWSGMTALCGMAQTFVTLLLARIGVGLGEAGGGPAALSIISDLYPHQRRATAMAIFSLGTPTAALINLTVNTQITHAYGWRVALFAAAAPGVILALVLWLFMAEPTRGAADHRSAETKAPPLTSTLAYVWKQRSLVHLLTGAMIAYIVLAGVSSWNFSYLVREHGANLHEIGPYLGIGISAAGLFGLYATGRLSDFLAQRDERWRCWIMAATTVTSVAFGILTFTTPSLTTAIIATAGLAACATIWLAPGYALTQSLVGIRMRGTVAAIVFLLANLVGYGVGPLIIGALSDLFTSNGAANALQLAIITILCANVWAAAHFLLAARHVRADLARVSN